MAANVKTATKQGATEDQIFNAGCNFLWDSLQGFKKTAAQAIDFAEGDEDLARKAYGAYIDKLLKGQEADHDDSTLEMTRDILMSMFEGAVNHAAVC